MKLPITFEQIPSVFAVLFDKVEKIDKNLELLVRESKNLHAQDEILNVSEAAEFLNLAVPTVYSLNSKGVLPSMKRSKKLYFLKKDLIDYLKQGRRQSQAEIEADASHILKQKKRGAK